MAALPGQHRPICQPYTCLLLPPAPATCCLVDRRMDGWVDDAGPVSGKPGLALQCGLYCWMITSGAPDTGIMHLGGPCYPFNSQQHHLANGAELN